MITEQQPIDKAELSHDGYTGVGIRLLTEDGATQVILVAETTAELLEVAAANFPYLTFSKEDVGPVAVLAHKPRPPQTDA